MSVSDHADHEANLLLRGLTSTEISRLTPKLTPVSLAAGEILYEPGDAISSVYFPTSAVVAQMNVMEDGESVEVAVVGYEGQVGIEVFWGREAALARAMALLPGGALKMATEAYREEVMDMLRTPLTRYGQALVAQIFQSAGCNRLHSVEERCARWLLMLHDRVKSDEFPLTQEMLSQMLGVRRQSVGVVADGLQKAGLIHYSRGKIRIRSRKGLVTAACECYRRVRDESDWP